MKKIFIKSLQGYVFIDEFDENSERADIYDEKMRYIDYISLDGKSKENYETIITYIENSTDIEDFIEYTTGVLNCYHDKKLVNLLKNMYANEVESDIKNLTEKELLEKYDICKVGNYYFYVADWRC